MPGKTQLKINKGQHRTLSVMVKPNASLLRVESVRNQEYAVTPAIILVEGTLQGALADAPELALASEFGKIPQAWNGRPVVVNHPRRNDEFVFAGQPDVWEQEVIGWVFNARIEDAKLKCELWTNKAWMEESGYTELKDNVENSTTMEVSTGLFADIEQVEGIWNGEQYSGIWRNVVPDHLAILTNSPGACSVADGCGTARTNQKTPNPTQEQAMCKNNGEDKSQERNPGVFQRLMSLMSSFKPQAEGLSTSDLSSAVHSALGAVEKNFYLVAVFDARVVYETYTDSDGWIVMQRDYSVDAAGTITIGSAAIQVRPRTDFVPVNVVVNALEGTTDEPAKVEKTEEAAPVANAAEGTAEGTEVAATTDLADDEGKISAAEIAAADKGVAGDEGKETLIPVVLESTTVDNSLDAFLKGGDSKDVARVNEALTVLAQRRKELTETIVNTPKNAFGVDELAAMNVSQLEKIAAFAQKVDYSGNASPHVQSRAADEGGNTPPKAFPHIVASK